MRRTFVSLLGGAAFIAFAGAAEAQTIGFKLGAAFSNLSVESTLEAETSGRTGFVGGGFVRFGMGRIGIQPEILTVSKGGEIDAGDGPSTFSLEYIEVPVLLFLPFSMGTSFAPYVVAGPAFGFEIGCTTTGDAVEGDCDDSNAFRRKKTDVGLTAGGGLEFGMGPGAILIEGRYTWGMTNIFDDERTTLDIEIKNRSAYLTAGYSIPLGRRY